MIITMVPAHVRELTRQLPCDHLGTFFSYSQRIFQEEIVITLLACIDHVQLAIKCVVTTIIR